MMDRKLQELRQRAGQSDVLSNFEKEQLGKIIKSERDAEPQERTVALQSEQMVVFLFESVIRPSDKALVIHLKHLPIKLRNRKFFELATLFFRDRIGKFKTLDASFIGELDSVNKLNSLDLIFTDYYPAKLGDIEFIKSHTFKIGKEFNDLLMRELQVYADSHKA